MERLLRLINSFSFVFDKLLTQGPKQVKNVSAVPVHAPKVVRKRAAYLPALLLFGAVLFSGPGYSQTVDLAVTPPSSTVNPGETFTLTVEVSPNGSQAYSAVEVYLSYDPSVLQAQTLTPVGSALGLPLVPTFIDNTNGIVGYGAGTFSNFPNTGLDFLQVEFQAVSAGSSDILFTNPLSGAGSTNVAFEGVDVTGNTTGAAVTVAEPPVASFTFTPNNPEVNNVVFFNASASTDSDGTIVGYAWDFDGDGNVDDTTTGATPDFTYTAAGTYDASLTVTDNDNLTDTFVLPVTVSDVSTVSYTLTPQVVGGVGGSISPSTAVSVSENGSQLFTFTPDPGFEVSAVEVDGNAVAVANSYEFTKVTSNATLSVTFSEIAPFQLCIASGSGNLNAFGRDFIGDPNTAPPTGLGFSRTEGKVFAGYSNAIAGTTPGSGEELLFQKEIYGGAGSASGNPSFIYDIPVANGTYQVDLYFAEVFHDGANGRVFDVFLDGNLILDEYDLVNPVKDGLSANQTAITRTYFVNVTDGSVSLQIGDATVDNGKLSGICVTAVSNANLHPLSTIGDLTVEAGVAAAAPVNVSDPEDDALTVVLNGLPASLSYNASTKQIEGTPDITDAGIYTINAIVSDGTNSPVTEEFTLTVAGDDPPSIVVIDDIFGTEGAPVSVPIEVNDDTNPSASIEIFDVGAGGTNNPFTPTSSVVVGTLTDNGGGSYTFDWTPAAGEGKSYLAVVTADDGVNAPVTESFRINVAQPIPATVFARNFYNPDPWYGGSPGVGFTVAIETTPAQNIGWIDIDEFVDYYLDVPSTGPFEIAIAAANNSGSATTITILEEDGSGGFTSIGSVEVPNNGDWQAYTYYNTQVAFSNPGEQSLRLQFNGGSNVRDFIVTDPAGNAPVIEIGGAADKVVAEGGTLSVPVTLSDLDNDNLTLTVTTVSDEPELLQTTNAGFQRDPFPNTANGFLMVNETSNSPGALTADLNFSPIFGDGGGADGDGSGTYTITLQADDGNTTVSESFVLTVNDVAQPIAGSGVTRIEAESFDNQGPPNPGSGSNGIGVEDNTSDGGVINTGFTHNGDFAEYQIDVAQAGTYQFTFAVAKASGPASTMTLNGGPENIAVDAPTGGWQVYQDFTVEKDLPAGVQTLRFDWVSGQNGFLFNMDYVDIELLAPANEAPVVAIAGPADINVSRGTAVSFTGTATDDNDGDLSSSVLWNTDDIQAFISPTGAGAAKDITFVRPGTTEVSAEVTDSGSLTGSDTFTVNVSAPAVSFLSPSEGAILNSLTVNVEVDPTDVLFADYAEHFHFYINPPDINNIDEDTRISSAPETASFKISETEFVFDENSGALAANGLGNGIVEGPNTIVVVVADQFHSQFTNPEAFAVVNFTVDLSDNTDPVAVCQDITIGLDENGNASITAQDIDGGSSDNIAIESLSVDVSSFTAADLGDNTVTLTVTDTSGNTATCTATVTVEDSISPVASCTPFTLELGEDGTATLSPESVNGSSSDNVGIASVSVFPDIFDCQDIGAQTVTLTVTDTSGNSDSCTTTVTIEDVTAPVLTCPADISDVSPTGVPIGIDITPPSALDSCDPVLSLSGLATRPDTSTFALTDQPGNYLFPAGTTQIVWTATDNYGNTGTCVQTVNVGFTPSGASAITSFSVNDTPGTINGNEISVLLIAGTDLTSVAPEIEISEFATISPQSGVQQDFSTGTVPYTVTAQDGSSQTTYNVTVNAAPLADAGSDITVTDIDGSGSEPVMLDASGSSDEGTIVSYVWTDGPTQIATGEMPTFSFAQGATTVTLTVTDNLGATATDEVVVTVTVDEEAPSITCPPAPAALMADANCQAILPDYTAGVVASDAVSDVTITQSPVAGTLVTDGTTVTFTATDASGNAASCNFSISVTDGTAPDITCPADKTVQGDLNGDFVLPDYTSELTVSDNCDLAVAIVQSPAAGTTVSGTTTVLFTATDAAGNSAGCSFDVTVDILPPASLAISPSSMEVTLFVGQSQDVEYVVDSDDGSSLPTPAAMTLTDDATGIAPTWASTTSAANQGTPYEVAFNATGLSPGTYTGTLAAGPVSGYNDTSIPITLNVEAVPPLVVLEFVLVDADANADLFTITEGMLIDVTSLPTDNLNIRAEAGPDTESVALQLTGPQNQTQTENFAPYALFGDASGNYNPNVFPLGSYSLSGTAYSSDGAGGTSGTSASVNFTFTDENPACASFNAFLSDTANPGSCGGADGSISIGVSGGQAPYIYAWSHDASLNSDTATGLTEGSYTVTVTDANGCIDIVSTSLSDPAGPLVSLAPFGTVQDTDAPFALTGGSPAGGEYTGTGVSGGQFDPSIGPGTYAITYTFTADGCTGSATQNIVVTSELGDAALIVLDATTDTELFALTDGLVIYKNEIGDTPLGVIYNADLNPGGVFFSLTGPLTESRSEGPEPHSLFGDIGVDIQGKPFPVGAYTLVANPVNGPTITVNFTVADLDPDCIGFEAIVASSTDSNSCSDPDGFITVKTVGGTAPFSYQWSHDGSLNSATASGLSAGSYTVTVMDANGCTDVVSTSIGEPLGPLVSLAPFGEVLESDPVFELTGGSPAGGVYSGPGVSGGFFNPSIGPGTYTITYTVTDANGCTGANTQDLVVTTELGDAVLIVLDATTDTELFALTDGLVIYKDDIGETPLGVIYNADLNPGGVFFTLSGPINQFSSEGPPPHSLFGDIGVDIQGKPFPIGDYTLVVNAINSSAPDLTVNFSVVPGSASAKVAMATKQQIPMTASPNPADDEVHLAFEMPTKIETFRIFDTAGRLVKTVQAMPGTDLRTYDLTVLDLPMGMYYVRAMDAEGNSYQEQIIISRF